MILKKSKKIVLEHILTKCGENAVIDISTFIYTRNYVNLLKKRNVVRILLEDEPVNIANRIIFTDENDNLLPKDGSLQEDFKMYLRKVKDSIQWTKSAFSKIENRYNIKGNNAEKSAEDIVQMIKRGECTYM